MRTFPTIAALFILLSIAAFVGCSKPDTTISVSDDDPEMNTAIAKARESLPQFWKLFEHPEHGENDFCLKVMIKDGKQVEHFWVEKLERKDGKTFGSISNDPDFVHNVKLGDRIEIPEPDISDWFYMRDGKMVGNYTMRVLFKHMSAKEVEKYKAILAEP